MVFTIPRRPFSLSHVDGPPQAPQPGHAGGQVVDPFTYPSSPAVSDPPHHASLGLSTPLPIASSGSSNGLSVHVLVYHAGCYSRWPALRREKHNRRHVKRMHFPPFDDEEPPPDYRDNILDVEPLEAIRLGIGEEEDSPIFECFYSHQPPVDTAIVSGEGY
ncbi:pre-mRNA-splicing factor 8, partial [Ceratobasidium sp. UAMH 11750]